MLAVWNPKPGKIFNEYLHSLSVCHTNMKLWSSQNIWYFTCSLIVLGILRMFFPFPFCNKLICFKVLAMLIISKLPRCREEIFIYCTAVWRWESQVNVIFSPPCNRLLQSSLSVSAYNHNLLHYLPMQSNRKHISLDPMEQKSFLP